MAGPPEIETPSPKGIIYSIILPSIHLTYAHHVHVVGRWEITKTRFHSFPQDFIPHPVLEGGTLVVITVTLVYVINVVTDPLSLSIILISSK